MEYRGITIYVQQFQDMFQYFFPWNGEVYQQHVFLKPANKKTKIYTSKELEGVEAVLLNAAMKSVDILADKSVEALIPANS